MSGRRNCKPLQNNTYDRVEYVNSLKDNDIIEICVVEYVCDNSYYTNYDDRWMISTVTNWDQVTIGVYKEMISAIAFYKLDHIKILVRIPNSMGFMEDLVQNYAKELSALKQKQQEEALKAKEEARIKKEAAAAKKAERDRKAAEKAAKEEEKLLQSLLEKRNLTLKDLPLKD